MVKIEEAAAKAIDIALALCKEFARLSRAGVDLNLRYDGTEGEEEDFPDLLIGCALDWIGIPPEFHACPDGEEFSRDWHYSMLDGANAGDGEKLIDEFIEAEKRRQLDKLDFPVQHS